MRPPSKRVLVRALRREMLDVDAVSADEAEKVVAEVADRVLANPVIESYRVEVE